ncbi:MAG: SDR family oxidoreductase [Deferribacterota bacterium]|nr:SDR family oxidoreductase [Deferribacterota bacterium]
MYKPDEMFSVKDMVTFVTGAASGLGRAIALGFDALGAKVILADINEEGIEETAKECNGDILRIKLDVTDINSVQEAVKKSVAKYKKIDVSFNIPGINIRKPALELTYDEFDKIMKVNLYGVFMCAKEVGKIMYDQKKGSMINMASIFSEIIMPKQIGYASSKGAVRQMTRVLAAEWAPFVRVNAIGPAYIETSLVKEVMKDKSWYDNIRNQNMFKRFGKPEEIVGPAVFLASNASSLVTGFLLLADAGWHCFGGSV